MSRHYYLNTYNPPEEEYDYRLYIFISALMVISILIIFASLSREQGYCLIQQEPLFFNTSTPYEIYFLTHFKEGCNNTVTTKDEQVLIEYYTNDPEIANRVYENLQYHFIQSRPLYCMKSRRSQSIPLPTQNC